MLIGAAVTVLISTKSWQQMASVPSGGMVQALSADLTDHLICILQPFPSSPSLHTRASGTERGVSSRLERGSPLLGESSVKVHVAAARGKACSEFERKDEEERRKET